MASATPLAVGIIGLGRIAEGYDSPDGPGIATHIKACLHDDRLKIAWIADVDAARAAAVRARWNLSAEIVAPDVLVQKRPDILCIASPDETHPAWIEAALKTPPRLLLCEKPLSQNLADAERLVGAARAASVPLAVNFFRRWLPDVAAWLAKARSGGFGAPMAGRLSYCRGLRHNACHGFDILGAAFPGAVTRAAKVGPALDDFTDWDPTVSGILEVESNGRRIPITLLGADGRLANVFELDLLFADGRLRIWNEGGLRMRIYGAAARPAGGIATEFRVEHDFHDNPPRHMLAVWRNLADHLLTGAALCCRAEDTIDGMRLVEKMAQAPVLR